VNDLLEQERRYQQKGKIVARRGINESGRRIGKEEKNLGNF
jgi:hypothetical protein